MKKNEFRKLMVEEIKKINLTLSKILAEQKNQEGYLHEDMNDIMEHIENLEKKDFGENIPDYEICPKCGDKLYLDKTFILNKVEKSNTKL